MVVGWDEEDDDDRGQKENDTVSVIVVTAAEQRGRIWCIRCVSYVRRGGGRVYSFPSVVMRFDFLAFAFVRGETLSIERARTYSRPETETGRPAPRPRARRIYGSRRVADVFRRRGPENCCYRRRSGVRLVPRELGHRGKPESFFERNRLICYGDSRISRCRR